ncbi:MAG: M24 family metallopeptidase [Bacteriovoracaceae bacterium]|nr:M24 family metallopeptidase [Bacteriovoracaceae bacterium]
MKSSFKLTKAEIKSNIEALKKMMKTQKLEAFYVSSFDANLSEYTPLEDCHRFYFTGFTGSTADILVMADDKVRLYVDGRYFEQADLEIDKKEVEVVKCQASPGMELLNDLKNLKLKKVGCETERTPYQYYLKMQKACQVELVSTSEIEKYVRFKHILSQNPVEFIPKKFRGADTKDKCKRVLDHSKHAYFTTAIDNVSWISNCRGYHLINLSSFVAKAIVTKERVYLFIQPEIKISDEALKQKELEFIPTPEAMFEKNLKKLQSTLKLQLVKVDSSLLSTADYKIAENVFGPSSLLEEAGGLYNYQSIKEADELKEITRSFENSSRAVFNTIKWVKESIAAGEKVSEADIRSQTQTQYEKTGSRGHSFSTIVGVGPNSSIIHYSAASPDVIAKKSDFILLDSGGYYDGGFSTDTTRTFLADSKTKADPKFIEIYTLVLKGLLRLQNSVFPENAPGAVLDGFARQPIFQQGYNYNHGTGHGVGLHVHEPCVRIAPTSQIPMRAGQVVSIEPGIYIPGFGGVRLENIAVVEKHPKHKGFLCFRNLVWVGFEKNLIDNSLLNPEEKAWLKEYEESCQKFGTQF